MPNNQSNNTPPTPPSNAKPSTASAGMGGKAKGKLAYLKQAGRYVEKIATYWMDVQDAAFKAGRTMGASRQAAMAMDRELMENTKNLARAYGVTANEIAAYQADYAKQVGRNIQLTKSQTEAFAAMYKVADKSSVDELVSNLDNMGVGIKDAEAYIGRIQETAKYFGVNASKTTQDFANNVKLASSYSFRNGVKDIEQMTVQSESLKLNMKAVMSSTEKFANITDAISTSANLQMLGGSYAQQFSNPMGAMYEATSDPKAFQERIVKTFENKGNYDKKTGEVHFAPVDMAMMREAAKSLGMSVDDLTNIASSSAQNKAVDSELNKNANIGQFSADQRMAIENLSKTNYENGQHYVNVLGQNGESQKINVKDLTPEQLKVAQDSQMTEENMYKDVHLIQSDMSILVRGRARGTTSARENLHGLSTEGKAFGAQTLNPLFSFGSNAINGRNFRPWDNIKRMFDFSGIFGKPLGSYNGMGGSVQGFGGNSSNIYMAHGGIVPNKPLHAELGTYIPGDSYSGDHVPVMANSGEMILNEDEQSNLFSMLKDSAIAGLSIYGGNKLGKHFGLGNLGYKGLGMSMLGGGGFFSNLLSSAVLSKIFGGASGAQTNNGATVNASRAQTAQVNNANNALGSLANNANHAANSMNGVNDANESLSKRFKQFGRKWSKVTAVGRGARNLDAFAIKKGRYATASAKNWISTRNGAAYYRNIKNFAGNAYKGSKAEEFFKDFKNIFAKGSTSGAATTAEATAERTATTAASTVANTGESTLAKGLLKGGAKSFGKAIPLLGTVLTAGMALSDISSAEDTYNSRMSAVNSDAQMSEYSKAQAKDDAEKERNSSRGSAVGTAAGTAIGAALGTAIPIPVIGTAIGAAAGGWLGSKAGSLIGGMFGGDNTEKLLNKSNNNDDSSTDVLEKIYEFLTTGKITSGEKKSGVNAMDIAQTGMLTAINPMLGIADMTSKLIGSTVTSLPTIGSSPHLALQDNNSNRGTFSSNKIGPSNIKLDVSGTIKLDLGGKSANVDANKLLNSTEFQNKLAEIITRKLNNEGNGGKYNKEGRIQNTQKIYNKIS